MFQKGQRVVCVNDTFSPGIRSFFTALPVKDKQYIVRGVAPGVQIDAKTEDISVYLEGLHNPCSNVPPFRERGFSMDRFAPLEELPVPPVEESKPVEVCELLADEVDKAWRDSSVCLK